MAKKKTEEPVVTLHREVRADGCIRLTSTYGVIDIRNNIMYSEVVCKPQNEHFFKPMEAGEESNEPSA